MIEKLKKYSYLSGATFFDLLVETKANTDSEGNEISNYQILLELAKVFKDDEDLSFDGKGATEQTSKYRSGTAGAPVFLGLDDEQLVKKFIDRVKTNRNGIEDKISDFIKSYLYIENENPWIVYALLDMIKNDELIPSDVVLFSDGDGNCVTKDNINEIACVDLASVMVWNWNQSLWMLQ